MTTRLPALLVCAVSVFSAAPVMACSYARSPLASYYIVFPMFIVGALLFWYIIKKLRVASSGDMELKTPVRIWLLCLFMVALTLVATSVASLFETNPCEDWMRQTNPVIIKDAPVAPIEPLNNSTPADGPIPLVP